MFIRGRTLKKMFVTSYQDLLRAIANDNYDAIENLCEQNLTLELAAKIYELEKQHGIQFRILNKDKSILEAEKEAANRINNPKIGLPQREVKGPKVVKQPDAKIEFDVKIINHFWVGNMNIDRESNPTLNEYRMI